MSGSALLIGIVGGVALLLWGIRMVRTGVMRAFGTALRRLVGRHVANRTQGFLAGIGLTGVLQSSAATGLIVASFAGRGLIRPVAALGVMLGADVGSSLVVQALSFHVDWLAPLFIAMGVALFMSGAGASLRNLGRAIIGVGLVLLALQMLVQSSTPLRESQSLPVMLAPLAAEPLLAMLLVAGITWLAHSGVAVVLLIASFTAAGILNAETALSLVLGANLGSAILPAALTARADTKARRITFGNLAMRGSAALALLGAVPMLHPIVAMIDPDPARQVVNFHLCFNLIVAAVFLPLLGSVARLMTILIKEGDQCAGEKPVQHLDSGVLDTPALALACAARETLRMGDKVAEMLVQTMDALRQDDAQLVRDIEASDDAVDLIHEAIKLYLTRLSLEELDVTERERVVTILSFAANLEHIGDIVDKSLMCLAAKRIRKRYAFSVDGLEDLVGFHRQVQANLRLALGVFIDGDQTLARQLVREKVAIREAELGLVQRHYDRVSAGRADSIETSSLHLDILRDLKRINSHLTSVAYPILEKTGELAASRLKPGALHPSPAR